MLEITVTQRFFTSCVIFNKYYFSCEPLRPGWTIRSYAAFVCTVGICACVGGLLYDFQSRNTYSYGSADQQRVWVTETSKGPGCVGHLNQPLPTETYPPIEKQRERSNFYARFLTKRTSQCYSNRPKKYKLNVKILEKYPVQVYFS